MGAAGNVLHGRPSAGCVRVCVPCFGSASNFDVPAKGRPHLLTLTPSSPIDRRPTTRRQALIAIIAPDLSQPSPSPPSSSSHPQPLLNPTDLPTRALLLDFLAAAMERGLVGTTGLLLRRGLPPAGPAGGGGGGGRGGESDAKLLLAVLLELATPESLLRQGKERCQVNKY